MQFNRKPNKWKPTQKVTVPVPVHIEGVCLNCAIYTGLENLQFLNNIDDELPVSALLDDELLNDELLNDELLEEGLTDKEVLLVVLEDMLEETLPRR